MTESEREPWVEKYRPEKWSDIQGNNKSVEKIREWATRWTPGDKAQHLDGPPGTGKTTIAYVTAETMGWPLEQVNASSARKTDDIEDIAGSINSTPPDAEHKVVLLDEVDSMHHAVNFDPLANALESPRNPVFLTSNDAYQVPNGLTRKATKHDVKLQDRSCAAKLRDIAEAEDLDLDSSDIDKLASRGNLRAAIHDMQINSETGLPPGLDERTSDLSDFDSMANVLKGEMKVGDSMTPEDMVLWFDHNLTKEWRGIEVGVAYDTLARADKWLGRAQDTRNYRWWKYAAELSEQVTELLLHEPYQGYRQDVFPAWFKHSEVKATSEKPISSLYRKLSRYDEGTFQFGGDFHYFRKVIIPILNDQPEEDRFRLALDYGLTEDEMEPLGIDEEQYRDWREMEAPSEGDGSAGQTSALDW